METPPVDYSALADQAPTQNAAKPVDYSALADQARTQNAAKPVDYAALAEQARSSQPQQESWSDKLGALKYALPFDPDVAEGIYSGAASTVGGIADLGTKAARGIAQLTGGKTTPENPTDNPWVRRQMTPPDTIAGKAGKFAEQAAEFAIPATKVGKLAKAADLGLGIKTALQGATAGGVGAAQSGGNPLATGMAAGLGALGEVATPMLDAIASYAPVLYQKALRPLVGKPDVKLADIQNLVARGIKTNTPVSEGGLGATWQRIQDTSQKIYNELKALGERGAGIEPTEVVKPLDEIMGGPTSVTPNAAQSEMASARAQYLAKHSAPQPVTPIKQVRDPWTNQPRIERGAVNPNIQPQPYDSLAAQAEKQKTYQELGDAAFGHQTGAWTTARKQLTRGVKEQIEKIYPEVKGLNADEGLDLELADAIEHRMKLAGNRQLGSITSWHSVAGILQEPAIFSRLALLMTKAGNPHPVMSIAGRLMQGSAQAATTSLARGSSAMHNGRPATIENVNPDGTANIRYTDSGPDLASPGDR